MQRFSFLAALLLLQAAAVYAQRYIHDVQGAGHWSPLVDQLVQLRPAIVTGRASNGFYIQSPEADYDNDPATSEGLFVFTSSAPPATVTVGALVQVNGTVVEFVPNAARTQLPLTQISSPGRAFSVINASNPLPAPVLIGDQLSTRPLPLELISLPGNLTPNTTAAQQQFQPTVEGIDFFEALEGMLVQVDQPQAVGPTTSFREVWVVANRGRSVTTLTPRGGVIITQTDFNPERVQLTPDLLSANTEMPNVDVGAFSAAPVTGVIGYAFNNYRMQVTSRVTFTPSTLAPEVTILTGTEDKLTVGTLNVENLDPNDSATKFDALARIVVTNMKSPDILSVEEVQDNNGAPTGNPNDGVVDADRTLNLLITNIIGAGGPQYQYRQVSPVFGTNGGEPGGNIRVAFLFNPARVSFVDRPGGNSTTAVAVNNVTGTPELSFSPGLIDPTNSAFTSSRKPLVGEFKFGGNTVFVVGNHFNSKGGDGALYGGIQPPILTSETQRVAQANLVAAFVREVLAIDASANVVVAGDLNDFQWSPPLMVLEAAGMTALVNKLPANERYTYVFQGNSQVLDHILTSPSLTTEAEVDVLHVNSEFWDQASDHDPVLSRLNLPSCRQQPAAVGAARDFNCTLPAGRNARCITTCRANNETVVATCSPAGAWTITSGSCPPVVPPGNEKELEIIVKYRGKEVEEGSTIKVEGKKWGAFVSYQAYATLGGKGKGRIVRVSCNPASPARVRVGRTPVRCTATAPEVAPATFNFFIKVEEDDRR